MVVPSGGKRWHGHIEANSMRNALVIMGVPPDRILLETSSMNTAENALFTTHLAMQHGWTRLAVVTCPWHLPRAIVDFHRCGMDVIPIAADQPAFSHWYGAYHKVRESICTRIDGVRLWGKTP
jgi:uncharacterized SAM-binding protein YcdF (DUF218 family)